MYRVIPLIAATLFAIAPVAASAEAPPAAAPSPTSSPSQRLTLCRAGTAIPTRSEQLRDTPTAICPYDVGGLYNRLGALLGSEQRLSGITQLLVALGLPALPTRYDSRRDAAYSAQVSGEGGWTLQLSVHESAYPLDGKEDAFVPGIQPTRLFAIDQLDIRYDLHITPGAGAAAPDTCLTVKQVADQLLAAGWRDETMLAAGMVRDGGAAYPLFSHEDGRRVSLPMRTLSHQPSAAEMASTCLGELLMMQAPLDGKDAE